MNQLEPPGEIEEVIRSTDELATFVIQVYETFADDLEARIRAPLQQQIYDLTDRFTEVATKIQTDQRLHASEIRGVLNKTTALEASIRDALLTLQAHEQADRRHRETVLGGLREHASKLDGLNEKVDRLLGDGG